MVQTAEHWLGHDITHGRPFALPWWSSEFREALRGSEVAIGVQAQRSFHAGLGAVVEMAANRGAGG